MEEVLANLFLLRWKPHRLFKLFYESSNHRNPEAKPEHLSTLYGEGRILYQSLSYDQKNLPIDPRPFFVWKRARMHQKFKQKSQIVFFFSLPRTTYSEAEGKNPA